MPLRVRLTLVNATVLVAAIVLFSIVAYAEVSRNLAAAIDESLSPQAQNFGTLYETRGTLPTPPEQRVIPQPGVFASPTFLVQVLNPDGNAVERSSGLGNRRLPVNRAAVRQAGEGTDVYETVILDGQSVRVFTTALFAADEFIGYIQVARSLQATDEALELLRSTLVRVGAALLAASILTAWFIAGASLDPIGRITRAAADIAASGRLDRRLEPAHTRDEVERLADTFNRMLDRLQSAFVAQRRFVADASHELRTPLTIIRGNIEMLRRSGAVKNPEMQEALDDVVEESERLTRLVTGLLALARADAGQGFTLDPVRLDEIIGLVRREVQLISGGVHVQTGRVDEAEVHGNADALKQLLIILVHNGIKFTPVGGQVQLELVAQKGVAEITVRDTGVGISPDDLPNIFERFYRSALSRGQEGTGLGLAIARWIAEAHGGSISASSLPGEGACFSIRLPLSHQGPTARLAEKSPESIHTPRSLSA